MPIRNHKPNPQKQARAEKAKAWYAEMEDSRKGTIDACVKHTRAFGERDYEPVRFRGAEPAIQLEGTDTVSALFREDPANSVCLLNFASYTRPGGGFLTGAMAQEEALCSESPLANILTRFDGTFYKENRKHQNGGAYKDRMLLTPGVPFIRDADVRPASVLTCAAPNLRASHETEEENHDTVELRIDKLFAAAETSGAKTFIAGAWGCGVFGQDPAEIAELMLRRALRSNFERVVFAIPDMKSRNYAAFRDAVAEAVSYEQEDMR